MSALKDICYWCGAPAVSDDHIPPKSFYPKNGPTVRITVRSCDTHNAAFSKLDERMRYHIQGVCGGSETAINEFRDRTWRSVTRPQSAGFKKSLLDSAIPALLNGQMSIGHKVSRSDVDTFIERITRGLYFAEYGEPFPGRIGCLNTHIAHLGSDPRPMIAFAQSVRPTLKAGKVTNDNVFRYEIARTVEQTATGFFAIIQFYGELSCFAIGLDPWPSEMTDSF